MSFKALFYVFLGGGVGSSLRYAVSLYFKESTVLQTLLPNLIGCLLLGLFTHLWVSEGHPMRLLLILGCLGGLTTFSGYVGFIGQSGVLTVSSLSFFALNNVLGLALYFIGLRASQLFTS
jgi:CrcB protein